MQRSPLQELKQLQQELKQCGYNNDGHNEYGQQTPRWNPNGFIQNQDSKMSTIEKSPSRRRSRLRRSQTVDCTNSASDDRLDEAYAMQIEKVTSTPILFGSNDRSDSIIVGGRRAVQSPQFCGRRRKSVGAVEISKLQKMEEGSPFQNRATTNDNQPSTPRYNPVNSSMANPTKTNAGPRSTQTPHPRGRRRNSGGTVDVSKLQKMEEGSPFQNRATTNDNQLSTPGTPRHELANTCAESTPETDADLEFALPRLCSSSTRIYSTVMALHALTLSLSFSQSFVHRSRRVHVPA